MNHKRILLSAVALLFLSSVGCYTSRSHPSVNVSIVNKSAYPISETQALFGEKRCTWGTVGPTFKAVNGQYPYPITSQTKLRWQIGMETKTQVFDLHGVYPDGRSGELEFVVYDDRAEVTFRPD